MNYDTIIIELQKDEKAVASIAISKADLEVLQEKHQVSRSFIIEDMIHTMELGPENNQPKTEN